VTDIDCWWYDSSKDIFKKMKFYTYIYDKLKREVSTGNFIAEIDGLRFLAIMAVVLVHIQLFFVAKTPATFDYDNVLYFFVQNGFKGVEIFFVISGFVLAMPFAKYYLTGASKPKLKSYYYRRLTRLEPPYFLALLLFFSLHLIKGVYPVGDLARGLMFNFLYLQNFVWLKFQPIIGNITWTLEIEVQFYLIAPFLAKIFVFDKLKRRLILIGSIIALPVVNAVFVPAHISLYGYLFYFLIGFLIVDLYITEKKIWLDNTVSSIVGLAALIILFAVDIEPLLNKFVFILSLFVFIYLALTAPFWRKIFSNKLLTTIGGMCYTIYLLHTVVISGFGNSTVFWNISSSYEVTFLVQTLFLMIPIMVISSIYFILIEKPCMNKNWPLDLASWVKENYLKIKGRLLH
jgi:peptidoglycan/LPS O-acetylase OafA/YrhL